MAGDTGVPEGIQQPSYEEVFDLVPVACSVSRLSDGLILAVNGEWCSLAGIPRASVLGSTFTQLGFWCDDEQQIYLAHRDDTKRIFALRAAAGGQKLVRVRNRVLRTQNAELLVSSLTEVSEEAAVRTDLQRTLDELSHANLALRARLELHDEIEQLAQVGAWTNEAGKDELTWSKGLHAITGLQGCSPLDKATARSGIHPEDLPTWLKAREAMDGRSVDFRWITPQGQTRWLRGRMGRSRVPGNREADFGVVQDISPEIEARQALQSQLDLINEIAQRVPGVMYQVHRSPDGQTEVTFLSDQAEQMLELGPHEHKTDPRALFARAHPEDLPRLLNDLDRCASLGLNLREHYRICLPSGAERWLRFEASPRKQANGSVLWHGYVADVTDERNARSAMERQQQLLQAVSTALSLYITSDGKTEVFVHLLESIGEVVGPSASFLAEMATRANEVQQLPTKLEGVFLSAAGQPQAFSLDDTATLDMLADGRAVVLEARHPSHAALHQGSRTGDPMVLVPLLAQSELIGLIGLEHSEPDTVINELGFLEPLTRAAAQMLLAWRAHSERASTLKRLADTTDQLSTQRRALQVVLDSMSQGLAKLESDERISFYNRQILELLDVPDAFMASGPTHAQVAAHLAQRGDFGESYELVDPVGRAYVKSTGDVEAPEIYLRRTRQGRYLEVGTRALPEGGAIRTITDVTPYMLTQQELATERQRLAWILEATRTGTWENNLETSELKVNCRWAEMVGYSLEELGEVSHATWKRLVHPDDLVRADAARDHHIAGRAPFYECDIRMRHKDGHWVWINTRGRVHRRASDGKPLYMSGTHIDISERVKAQEAVNALNENLEHLVADRTRNLERTLRDMEAIAYSIAHDLRTPLRSVNGFAAVLLESEAEHLGEAGTKSLARIVGSSARMGQMLTEMLDVLAVVRAEIRGESVDMNALAKDIDHQLGLRAGGVDVTLDPMPNAIGDQKLIKQALRNLMDNAWKYARDRQPPRVHLGYEATRDAYFVRDNGIGFDMTQSPKLFGLFQRLHGDPTVPGLGIGLAITSRIIERHGGRIWAEATPGDGATFWFSLPMGRSQSLIGLSDAQASG
ncbi:PAS domain-containing protein [Hydrogenophaga sp. A37]|uniref:PAS domain-containing protein n=1 Tax=Hydrogenophaga sp. A37 TaxID=1945864 RepID=UPI0015C543F1|nr:PAS domain-containing protein [Hydrogenophaga sp. A37]